MVHPWPFLAHFQPFWAEPPLRTNYAKYSIWPLPMGGGDAITITILFKTLLVQSLFSSSHFVILNSTVTFLRLPLTQRPKSGIWTFHVKFLDRSCLLLKGIYLCFCNSSTESNEISVFLLSWGGKLQKMIAGVRHWGKLRDKPKRGQENV